MLNGDGILNYQLPKNYCASSRIQIRVDVTLEWKPTLKISVLYVFLNYSSFVFMCRVCHAQEVTKYPWVFKLISSTEVKTLFFSVDTEYDLKVIY